MEGINTHGMKLDFGKHKGESYTRVPVGYLLWMVNVGHDRQDIARAELERRGTVVPECEISGHAIDKASFRCLDIWKQTRKQNEGLHAWLVRMVMEATKSFGAYQKIKPEDTETKLIHNGIKLVIDNGCVWPVLKTVMKK